MRRSPAHAADCLWRTAATLLLLSGGALAMLAVAAATGFRLRGFYSERLATPLGRLTLWLWGVRLAVHGFEAPAGGPPRVYISNHCSTIDVFVLIALGLPGTRFFLSGWLRRIPPIGLIGYLVGIFWTVPQAFPDRRTEIFRRADRRLRRTGESVYLSPEGRRVTDGSIGPFNKGAFHLATSLRATVVPFYIRIPPGIDPGLGLCARPGRVDVYFKPPIDAARWRLEDLERNREAVRARFLEWHREHHR